MYYDRQSVVRVIDEILVPFAHPETRCIFRGEAECYDKVSSGLYRQTYEIDNDDFNIMEVQREQLRFARDFDKASHDDIELMTRIQHLGERTNLIDFTSDLNVALFFACDLSPQHNGRIICLSLRPTKNKYRILRATQPSNMADVQKSYFVISEKGYIDDEDILVYEIDSSLKSGIIQYMEAAYGITRATIFNDLSGFIRYQAEYKSEKAELYAAINAFEDSSWDQVIKHLSAVIDERVSGDPLSHYYRAIAHYMNGDHESATRDLLEFDAYKWKEKPTPITKLKVLLDEEKARQQQAIKKASKPPPVDSMKDTSMICRLHISLRDPEGKPVSDATFRIQNSSGYCYHQQFTDDTLVIAIPSPLFGMDCLFWITKQGYTSLNNQRARIGDPFSAILIPKPDRVDLPQLNVLIECIQSTDAS